MDTNQLSPKEHVKSLRSVQRLMYGVCMIVPALYWLGVIDTGPVEWLQSAGILSLPVTDPDSFGFAKLFGSMNRLLLGFFGGISWAIVSAFCLMPFSRRIQLKFLGSEEALQAAQDAMHVAETTPVPLGDLVAVTVNRGGFLSHDESSVETTLGFYRVWGRVGDVPKGAAVTLLDGNLRITSNDDVTKKYTLLK